MLTYKCLLQCSVLFCCIQKRGNILPHLIRWPFFMAVKALAKEVFYWIVIFRILILHFYSIKEAFRPMPLLLFLIVILTSLLLHQAFQLFPYENSLLLQKG